MTKMCGSCDWTASNDKPRYAAYSDMHPILRRRSSKKKIMKTTLYPEMMHAHGEKPVVKK